jgi:hypothetical protein
MGMFSKMMNALSGQSDSLAAVRLTLEAAQQSRTKIAIEPRGANQPGVMTALIEQVREQDFVISQPSIGGMTHPLAFGETMRISFVNQAMYHSGETKCLGRVKIPSGQSGHTLFGYSMALPAAMDAEDRRSAPRVRLDFQRLPEAQLYSPALKGPVFGYVTDISMTGASVRTPLAAGRIIPGQEIFLKASLGEPVGVLDEVVDVARVHAEASSEQQIIGISFRRRIEGLDRLLRQSPPPEPVGHTTR